MSNLLLVTRAPSKAVQRKGVVPLMMEYGVSAETAPYLVSSTSSVMWIHEPQPGGFIRAAVRQVSLDRFFQDVIAALIPTGEQWGNVHPLTIEGLHAAVAHVNFYELGPLELLTPRAHLSDDEEDGAGPDDEEDGAGPDGGVLPVGLMPPELRPLIEDIGLPFRPSSWVPANTIVVVPKERTFVGVVSRVTAKKIAGVVHNAARGIAIARGQGPNELVGPSL